MNCNRCGVEASAEELRPPSRILQILAAPYFLLLSLKSSVLRGEVNAHYCRPCRRQLNFCFFFIAFLVVLFGTQFFIQYLRRN